MWGEDELAKSVFFSTPTSHASALLKTRAFKRKQAHIHHDLYGEKTPTAQYYTCEAQSVRVIYRPGEWKKVRAETILKRRYLSRTYVSAVVPTEQGVQFISEERPIIALPPQPQQHRGRVCERLLVPSGETERQSFGCCLGPKISSPSLFSPMNEYLSLTTAEIDLHA